MIVESSKVKFIALYCSIIVNVYGNAVSAATMNESDYVTLSRRIPSTIVPIIIDVSGIKRSNGALETTPVSGALVTIEDNGLKEGLVDATSLRKRAILEACRIRRTNFFGYAIAYIGASDNVVSDILVTHSIKIRGTLIVKADGYVPFSQSLETLLNAVGDDSRFTFKANVVPCCRVFLYPVEGKRGKRKGSKGGVRE